MKRNRVVTLAWVSLVLLASRAAADPIRYSRDIRPILAEHCFACHGPDQAARKARLRLDDRAAAVAREAFVPGVLLALEKVRELPPGLTVGLEALL